MTNPPSSLTLVVLAAGMGSRYGGLKQLDPVGPNGEVILDYSVFDAAAAGIDRVVFVIRKDFEKAFREGLGKRFESRISVDYAFQRLDALPSGHRVPDGRRKPWGTGHAILAARKNISTPFMVINADDFYGRDSYRTLAGHLSSTPSAGFSEKEPICMVGFPLRNTLSEYGTVARGLCRCNDAMELESVEEITNIRKTAKGAAYEAPGSGTVDLSGDEKVSMNMWGFQPSFLEKLAERFEHFLRTHGNSDKAEFYIPFAVDELIQQDQATAKVLTTESRWFGVTYQEDKPVVVEALQSLTNAGKYPTPLWG